MTSTLSLKSLVLLGAGHAHLQVLQHLRRHHPADLNVTLITPHPATVVEAALPAYLGGQDTLDQCQVPLAPLVQAAGVRWLQARCAGVDAATQTVWVAGEPDQPLHYDALSLDKVAPGERAQLEADTPGASTHALILRPLETFAALWPRVLEMAEGRALSIGVVGHSGAAVTLALTLQQRLAGSRVTLVTGGQAPASDRPAAVQARVRQRLQRHNITVLGDRCTGVAAGELRLGESASLLCDVPILANEARPPHWLADSGVALDAAGRVLTTPTRQSRSHPGVFAVGELAAQDEQAPSADDAWHAGPRLAQNLLAFLEGQPLQACASAAPALLACSATDALAKLGPWWVGGPLGRWLGHRRREAFMDRLRGDPF